MENLSDIPDPKVPPNEQNDQYIQFPFSFNGRNAISPIETG